MNIGYCGIDALNSIANLLEWYDIKKLNTNTYFMQTEKDAITFTVQDGKLVEFNMITSNDEMQQTRSTFIDYSFVVDEKLDLSGIEFETV